MFRCAQQDDRGHADRQGGRLAARRDLRQHRRGGGQRVGAVQSGHRAAPRASRRPPRRAFFEAHFAAATNGCRPPCGRHGGLGRGRPAARARPVGCAGRPWVGGRWRGSCGARAPVGAAALRAARGGARAPRARRPLPDRYRLLIVYYGVVLRAPSFDVDPFSRRASLVTAEMAVTAAVTVR